MDERQALDMILEHHRRLSGIAVLANHAAAVGYVAVLGLAGLAVFRSVFVAAGLAGAAFLLADHFPELLPF